MGGLPSCRHFPRCEMLGNVTARDTGQTKVFCHTKRQRSSSVVEQTNCKPSFCGVQSFFWDKLPDGRVAGTFWAAHAPDYGLLAPCMIAEAEELFQVLAFSTGSFQVRAAKRQISQCADAVKSLPGGVGMPSGSCSVTTSLRRRRRRGSRWPRRPRRWRSGGWRCWTSSAPPPLASSCSACGEASRKPAFWSF